MKPIEAGCMAIITGVRNPINNFVIGRCVKVIERHPLGWVLDIHTQGVVDAHYISARYLMRIDGEEFEEEQSEEALYDYQSN